MTTGSNDPGEYTGIHTDKIIASFEERLRQSIAGKTLVAAQDKQPLTLSDEELAYLTKQAVANSPIAQMEVAVPSPTITLKKGNTELNIKNAATILQKMEERFPTPKSQPLPQIPVTFNTPSGPVTKDPTPYDDDVTSDEVDEIIDELEKEIENPGSSERVRVSSKPVEGDEKAQASMVEKFKRCVNFPHSKVRPEVVAAVGLGDVNTTNIQSPPPQIQAVNRNAYEIREGVLSMALDYKKWEYEMAVNQRGEEKHIPLSIPSTREIMDTAQSFYKFVENKR